MSNTATIYALASGHGKAGVAVVRISGARARDVVTFLSEDKRLKPREATLIKLAENGSHLDSALAIYFPEPHSFTGEDVLELHTHGSPAVLRLLFEALSKIPGFRHAEPGEFSRRAFMNGKFDLLEAEGLADLIDATTYG
jgi:tRNA modification GTPase